MIRKRMEIGEWQAHRGVKQKMGIFNRLVTEGKTQMDKMDYMDDIYIAIM